MRLNRLLVFPVLAAMASLPLPAAPVTQAIKLDHFGYRPADLKIAIFTASPGAAVQIRDTADAVVFTVPYDGGTIINKGNDGAPSGDNVWWVDFTPFATPGVYRLYSPALGAQSYDFEIGDGVYNPAVRAALKSFYYQRCNTPKLAAHAGDWADPAACHMSDLATGPAPGHADYGLRDLTGGWHDAGDYNKYAWSAVSTAILTMLRAYEDNPGVFTDDLNIPESGNGLPDLLDEIKWELDWLMKMQLPDGSVLSQMHVPNFESNSPPSADTTPRYYQNPTLESGAVLAGTSALASRIYAAAGMTAYAATLKQAALNAWNWLLTQGDSKQKVWAAAEIFRLDSSVTSARNYVDSFYSNNWAGVFLDPPHYDSHAAITYVQAPGATPAVVANMRSQIAWQADYLFANDDLYRNGMPDWQYYWGSNSPRAVIGLFLLAAAKLNATGNHTPDECRRHALDFLHFFHGQNTLNMLYLSNMAASGGEHSSFQLYHAWFGDSNNSYSRTNFIGKPPAVAEPDYPYFKGTDNLGINDNKSSLYGPAPGFVPGGPNKNYSGDAIPPKNSLYYNRFYRDWNDQTVWTARTWEITENSIGYQGPYVALGAYFMTPSATPCTADAECDDGLFCNGAERCLAGACTPGEDPCPGQGCDEAADACSACDNDGVCEAGEDCANCPVDCISGGGGCGNGLCELAIGEDCLSCPADCNGKQGGNPKNQFCCGDGAGRNPVGCGDARCTTQGFACNPTPPEPYCCGDSACAGAESSCNCALDCGPPAASELLACADYQDNDCDGVTDCADNDCAADASCQPAGCDNDAVCEPGENCDTCPSDCPGKSNGPPSGRYCCGDGSLQPAEGSGAVCDGNP